jgi:hypothetical protein
MAVVVTMVSLVTSVLAVRIKVYGPLVTVSIRTQVVSLEHVARILWFDMVQQEIESAWG